MTHRWILSLKRFTRQEGYTFNRFLQAALTEGTSTSWALIYASYASKHTFTILSNKNRARMLLCMVFLSAPEVITADPCGTFTIFLFWGSFHMQKTVYRWDDDREKGVEQEKSSDKTRTLTAGRDVSRFPLVKVHRSITLVCYCSRVGKMDQGKGGKLNFPKARKWILRKKPK